MEYIYYAAIFILIIIMFRNWCKREDERVRRMFEQNKEE